ncbi:MAG: DUF2256 domain-containing protein [Sulfurovum sp.]
MSKRNSKAKSKTNLDSKICPTCQKPFTWRKKWERDWENVTYCSKLCQKNKNK